MGYYAKSKTDKWLTPPDLYTKLCNEFHFDFDPCPINYQKGDPDGLLIEWGQSSFCNPPYSQTAKWIKKAHDEWLKGKTVVMLINVCTDTVAFHEYIYGKAEIRFLKGRLRFINPERPLELNPNVRPSMVVIFKSPQK